MSSYCVGKNTNSKNSLLPNILGPVSPKYFCLHGQDIAVYLSWGFSNQWPWRLNLEYLLRILSQLHSGIEMNPEYYPSWCRPASLRSASTEPRGVLLFLGSQGWPCGTNRQFQTITGHTVFAVTFQNLAKPNNDVPPANIMTPWKENRCTERERKQLMWVYLWIFKPHIVRREDSGLVAHCSRPPVTIFLGNQNHIPLLKG